MIAEWANLYLAKQPETAIDICWTWDGRYLDTSGIATQR
jgi:hypothetical protein